MVTEFLGPIDESFLSNLGSLWSLFFQKNFAPCPLSTPPESIITSMLIGLTLLYRSLSLCSFLCNLILSLFFTLDNFYCSVFKYTDYFSCLLKSFVGPSSKAFILVIVFFKSRVSIWFF